ncbi:MAG: type 4a pilus biogenesis protein PilO [Pseudobdellovibrionaceae bacterium]
MVNNLLLRLAMMTSQRILVIGVVLGLIYYFMFFDGGEKQKKRITELNQKIKVEQAKLPESQAALKEVDLVRASVAALGEQFTRVSQQLPSNIQMSEIIRTVDDLARITGVSIKAKEPKPNVPRDVVEEVPLRINLEGSYSQITLFLYQIARLERLMKVKDFTISSPRESVGENARLIFEGEVASFRLAGEKKQ